MTFRIVAFATSALFLLLSIILVFQPEIVYWLFGLQQDSAADFLAKRAAMLFAGFATLCYLTSGSENREVKRVVSASVAVAMGALAVLGVVELVRGTAGYGILLAIVVELVIFGLFALFWRQHRDTARTVDL